jgi:hypothetical protein
VTDATAAAAAAVISAAFGVYGVDGAPARVTAGTGGGDCGAAAGCDCGCDCCCCCCGCSSMSLSAPTAAVGSDVIFVAPVTAARAASHTRASSVECASKMRSPPERRAIKKRTGAPLTTPGGCVMSSVTCVMSRKGRSLLFTLLGLPSLEVGVGYDAYRRNTPATGSSLKYLEGEGGCVCVCVCVCVWFATYRCKESERK